MKPADLRIVFAGTPEFAAVALRALIHANLAPVAVYCQPDRPAGRGMKAEPGPVKTTALQHRIPVEQPASFRCEDSLHTLASHRPDLMIVAAYGLILPESVLDCPPLGCINIHASLLPAWRGAAPIHRAIEAGDRHTGITLMRMDKGLDTGAMLMKVSTTIGPEETTGELHDRLARIGAEAVVEAIPQLASGTLQGEPQNPDQATYAHKISRDEARLDWTQSAVSLHRKIRAFNPWPVATTLLGGKVLKIWSAQVDTTWRDRHAPPGTLLPSGPGEILVACGDGALQLRRLQLPGGRPLASGEILNGHATLFATGSRLE